MAMRMARLPRRKGIDERALGEATGIGHKPGGKFVTRAIKPPYVRHDHVPAHACRGRPDRRGRLYLSHRRPAPRAADVRRRAGDVRERRGRSEEHTSALQSTIRISYAVLVL